MSAAKIFLVDDDKVFVFLTKKTIREADSTAEIKVFEDGELILNYLKGAVDNPALLPDIIFLDLSMPVMDGWKFLEAFLLLEPKIEKKIPIYLVTSSISPHDIERAKNISVVSDFIIKPLAREKVTELIRSLPFSGV